MEEVLKAVWNGEVIAESEDTVVVEGNHYFPPMSVHKEFLIPSSTQTTCPWKGVASYCSLIVNNEQNVDAAWYYANPKPEAENIKGYFAFWKGVEVV